MDGEARSELDALRLQVSAHLGRQQFEEALAAAIKARDLTGREFGEESEIHEEMMGLVAEVHRRAGNPALALPLFRVLLSRVRALGEIRLPYLFALRTVIEVCLDAGEAVEAERWLSEFRRVAPAVVAVDAEGPDYVIRFLNDFAEMWGIRGGNDLAREMLEDALDLASHRFGAGSEPHLQCLNNLASQVRDDGDLERADMMFSEVLRGLEALHGPLHPYIAMTLCNLAGLSTHQGRLALAEEKLERALQIFNECGMGRSQPAARALMSLAELHAEASRYNRAGELSDRALEILRAELEPTHPDLGRALHAVGRLRHALGDLEGAYSLYEQALEILTNAYGDGSPGALSVLNNMVNVDLAQFRYDRAEQMARRLVEGRRELSGGGGDNFVTALTNLASALEGLGEHEKAREAYEQCLETLRADGREDTMGYATVLNNLGLWHRDQGDYVAAERFHRDALRIRELHCGEGHPDISQSLNHLALILAATERSEQALDLKLRVEASADEEIGAVFAAGSERQRLTVHDQFRGQLYSFLSLVRTLLPDNPEAVQAALDLVLRRKGIGAEGLRAQRDAVLSGRYPELGPKLEELSRLRQSIADATLAAAGSVGNGVDQAQAERREALERELARSIPEMNLAARLRAADRVVVADALPEGSALLEFVRSGDYDYAARPSRGESRWRAERYLVFVLLAGAPEQVQLLDLGPADPIDDLIARYRRSVDVGGRELQPAGHSGGKRGGGERAGQLLRAAIFDPLLVALQGRTRLFIAPDGDLTRVNWSTLPAGDGGCLIETFRVSYLGTGRDLLRRQVVSDLQPSPSVVLGDPDYDLAAVPGPKSKATPGSRSRALRGSGLRFSRLVGTLDEAVEISGILGVKPLLGAEALEGRIKEARSPLVLHFATHGFFLPDAIGDTRLSRVESPLLRSGLALAGANTWLDGGTLPPEAEDALLNSEDVAGMDLLATELVVLSACDTGLGTVQIGEGVFGLQRAFLSAGASTVVMSLWRVPDDDTRSLMVRFYNGLRMGMRSDEALRDAQLHQLAEHPGEPGRWGAFICLGDCGPLTGL